MWNMFWFHSFLWPILSLCDPQTLVSHVAIDVECAIYIFVAALPSRLSLLRTPPSRRTHLLQTDLGLMCLALYQRKILSLKKSLPNNTLSTIFRMDNRVPETRATKVLVHPVMTPQPLTRPNQMLLTSVLDKNRCYRLKYDWLIDWLIILITNMNFYLFEHNLVHAAANCDMLFLPAKQW